MSLRSAGSTGNPLSRRQFLSASAAVLTLAALENSALASVFPQRVTGIDSTAFDHAAQRAAELVKRMTLEEVVPQLVHNAPAIPRLSLSTYHYWTEALHGVDMNGPVTSFPQPIALGCSWNPELVRRVYSVVSDEARAYHNTEGHSLAYFSPATVNMGLRDPRWGRANENFSEDPWLVQRLGIQATRGMQGDDPKYLKTISCAKHFVCNETDTDRDYADAAPDRRSFWEYYTQGFHACVTEGQVFTVMASYNSMWGVPCVADPMLLTKILRDRWGFKGYVVSDCDAVRDIYQTHHYVQTGPEAAALAIKAGADLNCGATYSEELLKSVQDKLVSEDVLRTALTRVLTGRFLLGEFDPPSSVPWGNITAGDLESRASRDLARQAARESLVLLKNDKQLLPLKKQSLKTVAIIGPMAGSCHLGGYSGRSIHLVPPYAGVSEALGAAPYADKVPADLFISSANFRAPIPGFADDGAASLVMIANNSWAQYGPLDLAGRTSLEFRIASIAEGDIDIFFDAFGGKPALTVHVPSTGSFDTWKTVTAPLSGHHEKSVAILKFRSQAKGEFMRLQWFQLLPAKPAAAASTRILYEPGGTILGPRNPALLDRAVQAAKEADVVLLFAGDNRLLSDEGRDRDYIHLPEAQHELIKAVAEANPRTVLIVNSCVPVALQWEKEHVPAILSALHAGQEQGNAIADALFGDYNPGGKLCSTWYRDLQHLPNFHDYDIKHGRTYMYFGGEPLYPFGYGLSYTTFEYRNLHVDTDTLRPGAAVTVSAEIVNTGHVAGDEIVQFYVHVHDKQQRPIRQLAAFERLSLQPGQKKSVRFTLPHDHIALRFWDDAKQQFTYEPAPVDLMVAASSADIRLRGKVNLV